MKNDILQMFEKDLIDLLASRGWRVIYENAASASEEVFAEIREEYFGASDSAMLLDVSPFGKRSDLINQKVHQFHDDSIGRKASVRMGKDIEHIILNKASTMLNLNVIKPQHMYGLLKSYLGINYDGIALEGSVLHPEFIPVEAKAVTKYGRKYYDFNKSFLYQKEGITQEEREYLVTSPALKFSEDYVVECAAENGIPVYYYTQLQQQLAPLPAKYGYLAVMDVDNWDIHIFKIERNQIVIDELLKLGAHYGLNMTTMRNIKEGVVQTTVGNVDDL